MLTSLWHRVRHSDLLLAGAAIGIAGFGRIALNSLVGFGFGPVALARYATAVASIMLWAGLANAGPSAAITLGVARRWGLKPGRVPTGLLRYLLQLTSCFLIAALVVGALLLDPSLRTTRWMWAAGVGLIVAYQVARALGYATQRAMLVTVSELVGAWAAMIGLGVLVLVGSDAPGQWLVGAYLLGPLAFLATFGLRWRATIRFEPEGSTSEERRLARRASGLFFLGAGSSMALQYLPVLIAGRVAAPSIAVVLFGALQATAPLLLLSRVYGTVMMPAFAARANDTRPQRHADIIRPLFLPTLALGLGLAPWVVVSLGLQPGLTSVVVAMMVAMITLMQGWATPAVTTLSSRRREWVPALSSLGGLLAATGVWVGALRGGDPMLIPIGLLLGGAVRSMLPVWIFTGRPIVPRDARIWIQVSGAALMIAWMTVLSRRGAIPALAGGTALLMVGMLLGVSVVRTLRRGDAHPAR